MLTVCCGVPEDIYDLVLIAETERDFAATFAAAFEGRNRQLRVAVVLPAGVGSGPDLRRPRDHRGGKEAMELVWQHFARW